MCTLTCGGILNADRVGLRSSGIWLPISYPELYSSVKDLRILEVKMKVVTVSQVEEREPGGGVLGRVPKRTLCLNRSLGWGLTWHDLTGHPCLSTTEWLYSSLEGLTQLRKTITLRVAFHHSEKMHYGQKRSCRVEFCRSQVQASHPLPEAKWKRKSLSHVRLLVTQSAEFSRLEYWSG